MYRFFSDHSVKYQVAQLPYCVRGSLVVQATAKLSSKVDFFFHFVFLLGANESSCFSISLPALVLSFKKIFLFLLKDMQWYLKILISNSVTIYENEHLFMYLCSMCISCLVWNLLRYFALFLVGLFVFQLVSCGHKLNHDIISPCKV